jgi:hypothetical protein
MKNLLFTLIFVFMSYVTFSQTPVNVYVINQGGCPYALTDTYVSLAGAGNMTLTSIDSMGFQNVHHYVINDTVYPITLTLCLYVGATQAPFPPQTPQCITQVLNSGAAITLATDCSILELNEITTNNKVILKVLDLMGREVSEQPNKPLVYVYSDGTREIKYINQ